MSARRIAALLAVVAVLLQPLDLRAEEPIRRGLWTKCKLRLGHRHCRMYGKPFPSIEPFVDEPRWHAPFYGPYVPAIHQV
jgi:hypothetical protein